MHRLDLVRFAPLLLLSACTPAPRVAVEARTPPGDAATAPPSTGHDAALTDAAESPSPDAAVAPDPRDSTPSPPGPEDAAVDAGTVDPTLCGGERCQPLGDVQMACVSLPAPRCSPDLRGHTYQATGFELALQSGAVSGIEAALPSLFGGGYSLAFVFAPAEAPGSSPVRFLAHLVQGAATDLDGIAHLVPGASTADARRLVQAMDGDPAAADPDLLGVWVAEDPASPHAGDPNAAPLGLTLLVPEDAAGGPCLRGLRIFPSIDVFGRRTGEDVALKGLFRFCLGALAARQLTLPAGARAPNLELLLAVAGTQDCDSNLDGDIDGWMMELRFTLRPTAFEGDPAPWVDAPVAPLCP